MGAYEEGKLDGDKWSTQSGGSRSLQWKADYCGRYVEVSGPVKKRQSNDSLGFFDRDVCVVQILYDVSTWRVT
jgi:hypothetical protein